MARPNKDDKKSTFLVIRTTEADKVRFNTLASNEGMTVSALVHLKCLGNEPNVTFASPERAKLINAIALLGQIVSFLNEIKPQDATQFLQIDSAIQGALLTFNMIQDELNGN